MRRLKMRTTRKKRGHAVRLGWGFVGILAAVLGRAEAADDPINGRVVGADGRPARGASVVLVQEGRPLTLTGGRLDPLFESPHAEAEADGRFRLARPAGRFALVAIDERGVAVRTAEEFATSPDLALRPWGRVSGTVRLGSRSDADRAVTMTNAWGDGSLSVNASRQTRADARGRFALDHVLPGLVIFARTGPSFGGLTSDLRWVDIEPGRTVTVDIGGVGRPVVGRVAFPKDVPAPQFTSGRAILGRALPPVPFPPESASWPAERKLAWRVAWDKTAEGDAHLRSQNRHVGPVASDGSFRVDDVPPGRYRLSVVLEQRLADAPPEAPARIAAQASVDVELPRTPGDADRSDEPFRLSPVTASVSARGPEVGEPAPDFTIQTLGDKPLRLSDFRGRYVLLDFWATWCVPCAEELPHLKATFDAFGAGGRFALIGLSLDDTPEPPRRYTESRGMAWTQGFLGSWASSPVTASYDVQAVPAIWLIGPDGRVVARNLHGPAIRTAVAKALDRP
jgi:peroxiredoxin